MIRSTMPKELWMTPRGQLMLEMALPILIAGTGTRPPGGLHPVLHVGGEEEGLSGFECLCESLRDESATDLRLYVNFDMNHVDADTSSGQ